MTPSSPGASGPHPDLAARIAASVADIAGGRCGPDQVDVLQQRTLFDRPHPRRDRIGRLAISSCLAVVRGAGRGADTLVLAEAGRADGEEEWRLMGYVSRGIGGPGPTREPVAAALSVMPGAGLNFGAVIADPHIATLRIDLADGTTIEDAIIDGSTLALAPFDSPAAWAEDATVRLLDRQGKELLSQAVSVNPAPPPGTPIPRPAGRA